VRLTLIEPIGVPEIFYSGIGAAHLIGSGIVEMLLYRDTPAVSSRASNIVLWRAYFGQRKRSRATLRWCLETIRGTRPPPYVVKLPQAG
jgi:hypothetical protein